MFRGYVIIINVARVEQSRIWRDALKYVSLDSDYLIVVLHVQFIR